MAEKKQGTTRLIIDPGNVRVDTHIPVDDRPLAYRAGGVVGNGVKRAFLDNPLVAPSRAVVAGGSALVNSPTVRSAIEGTFGLTPGALSAAEPVKAVEAAKPATAATTGAKVLAAGAAAPEALTPRAQLDTYLSNLLEKGATVRQVAALGPLVEGTPKPRTFKDTVAGQAAQLSQDVFANQVQSLQAQLAKGDINEEQARAEVAKATEAHFNRQAGLASSFDPTKLAMASLYNQDGND